MLRRRAESVSATVARPFRGPVASHRVQIHELATSHRRRRTFWAAKHDASDLIAPSERVKMEQIVSPGRKKTSQKRRLERRGTISTDNYYGWQQSAAECDRTAFSVRVRCVTNSQMMKCSADCQSPASTAFGRRAAPRQTNLVKMQQFSQLAADETELKIRCVRLQRQKEETIIFTMTI